MPQLTTPPVQLSTKSYWQLVDVMKWLHQQLPFISTAKQLTRGIKLVTCQLLDGLVLLQSSQPTR